MLDRAPDCRRIDLSPDEDVEIVLGPCDCPRGHVCPDNDPFAPACPRRGSAAPLWLVVRGPADAMSYVRKLLEEVGAVEWTDDHAAAHRFKARKAATYVQGCIVARGGGEVAVLADTAEG